MFKWHKQRNKKRVLEIKDIPIAKIRANMFQIRKPPEAHELSGLAKSIESHGILQPLLGRLLPDGTIEIAIGGRRLLAAQLAGLTTVPVIIKPLSDSQMIELSLLENLHRIDLSPLEAADGLHRAKTEFAIRKEEELANHLGLSVSDVSDILKLLKLPTLVKKSLKDGVISPPHAFLIASLPTEQAQLQLLEQIYTKNLSVTDTIKLLNTKNAPNEMEGS